MPNRSPVSELIKHVDDAIAYLENNLTPDEINLLLDKLAPLPEPEAQPKKSTKRASKKSNKPASKSARGQSISSAIQRTPKTKVDDDGNHNDPSPQYCLAMVDDNGGEVACGKTIDDNVHHKTTDPDYHEFDAGKSSLAQPARGRSSTNGAEKPTIPNSVDGTDDASNVHHAGG